MKRTVAVSLVVALALGMLATGVASAHGSTGNAKSGAPNGGNPGGVRALSTCSLTPAVSGVSIRARATPGKAGGSVKVEVRAKHAATPGTAFSATVTPTFPGSGSGALANLTRKGTTFLLTGTIPVPSAATAGNATLALAGAYGSSTFTCAGLTAKIMVPKPRKAPVCSSTPAGLHIRAMATPARPGGKLWVVVTVQKGKGSVTLAGTATATIPPAAPTPAKTLSELGKWPVLWGSFVVDKSATIGATVTVAVAGTYTAANVSTTFTCSLTETVKNIRPERTGKVR